MSELTITPLTITIPQIKHCLLLYPKVIEKHYASKIKDLKKVSEAVTRDKWRYDELPLSLSTDGGQGKGRHMRLEQLESLVQWKITHGHSRPFLPAMIRKNNPKEVAKRTDHVADLLARISRSIEESLAKKKHLPDMKEILDGTLNALSTASKLSGVGPATASLVLSVYDPVNMPFFEDEMFSWLCPDVGKAKLKYDKKEYSELVKRVWEMREHLTMGVSSVDIEKTAFVLQHWHLVDEKDQKMPGSNDILKANGKDVGSGGAAFDRAVDKEIAKEAEDAEDEKDAAKKLEAGNRGTKRGTPKIEAKAGKDKETDSGTRQSKRVKK